MNKKIISDAITEIGSKYIEKAADYKAKKNSRKILFVKWGAMAACFALLLSLAIPTALNIMKPSENSGELYTLEELNRPYKSSVAVVPYEMAIAWEWKYLTAYERFLSIDIGGVRYTRFGDEISNDFIGERLGTYEAVGDNSPYETPEGGYRERFNAYEIKNISADCMVALKMDGNYYSYISDTARGQLSDMTWGDVLGEYGLHDNIKFSGFAKHRSGRKTEYFKLKDDSYIWEVLSSLTDAPAVSPSKWKNDGEYCSFTVTSDALGIYKKAFYVTESGYIWTNILEVECIYNIGKEAAGKIIAYSLANSEKTEMEAYRKTVVGTVTKIAKDYILIDDSVLCNKADDGITFKVMLNDLRISRYVDDNRIKVGDVVEVAYKNSIDAANGYVIDSAISAITVMLMGDSFAVPESASEITVTSAVAVVTSAAERFSE